MATSTTKTGFGHRRILAVWAIALTTSLLTGPHSHADLLVDLSPGNLSLDGSTWSNSGTVGGAFSSTGLPWLVTDSGVTFDGNIVPGVVFNGGTGADAEYFTSDFNAPVSVEGNGIRTVEVWILNPALDDLPEETVVAWGNRGNPARSNLSFNYHSSAEFGAVATWGSGNDAGFEDFSNAPPVPATNQWHHLAWTYDGTSFGLYVDGVDAGTFTPGGALDTTIDQPIQIGFQNGTVGQTANIGLTSTINSVRIYDEVRSGTDITAAFDAGPVLGVVAPLTFEVDRVSGAMSLTNNSGASLQIVGYTIQSEFGALDQAGWTPIAGNTDAPPSGDGTFDDDDTWTILTAGDSHIDLSEFEFDGGDGGALGDGESLVFSVADGWIQSPTEDLTLAITLDNGTTLNLDPVYVGNGNQSFERSDLNFNGSVDAPDWSIFVENHLGEFVLESPAEAYQLGDLDGDGDNDFFDFRIFQADYDAAQGAGALAALIGGSSVPEPTTLLLAGVTFAVVLQVSRRQRS